MTIKVSIFNLPHILENIGFYLDRYDHASCALVNRAFYEAFKRLLWRELTFLVRPSTSVGLTIHPEQKRAILVNSRWVRQLRIHTHLRRDCMVTLLMSTCRHLTDLVSDVSLARKDGDAEFLNILRLATRNRRLKHWTLHAQTDFPPVPLRQLTDAISETSCLTVLQLWFVCSPRRGWLRRLLQNVPRTLKSLDVRWGGWNEEYGMDYFPIQDWPETYPCLQSANFAIDLIDDEQTVLAQFLTRCPSLKKLTLPTVERSEILSQVVTLLGSRESFPSLEVLDLGLNGQVDEHTWELLLLLMKGRIKGVAFCVPFSAPITRSFIGRMIQYWSETLETIHIGQPLSVAGSDIHLILTTCPKLKRFVCMHNRVVWPLVRPGDTPDAFPRQEAITNNGNNGGAAMENWICLELEELKLMFRDGRRARVDEPVLQEGPTIMAIRYAYQQVGRLTRLKDLVIGWRTTKAFANCANLDMSLKSGLGYMSDLKAMRMIDINHIYEVKLGMEEVQWMVENWPSLREIRGLEYQIDNVKEDECIEWLRTTRPDIIIQ